MKNYSKHQIATAIAILFHSIGLFGMIFFRSTDFVLTTPLNLLLMASLLFFTHENKNKAFISFFVICVVVGIGVEIVGTSTGLLFGNYKYGKVLGPTIAEVPYMIGINWFIMMYCFGVTANMILTKIVEKITRNSAATTKDVQVIAVVVDGALLAVLFDWLMEPVAVKLGYWTWLGDGEIPFYNYVCWFFISLILLLLFKKMPFRKSNKFAVNLLLIQSMFFLILRTFL
ncbi:MAG: carotenoid biosynthesis protein [Ferruginibacter sp.]